MSHLYVEIKIRRPDGTLVTSAQHAVNAGEQATWNFPQGQGIIVGGQLVTGYTLLLLKSSDAADAGVLGIF